MDITEETCRICLRDPSTIDKNEHWESVFLGETDFDQITYADKYNACTRLKVVCGDSNFGQKICLKCLNFLRKMYTFLKICIRTDKIFKKHIARKTSSHINTEIRREPDNEEPLFWEQEYLNSCSPDSVKIEVCEIDIKPQKRVHKPPVTFNVIELPDVTDTVQDNQNENTWSREKEEESFICEVCGNVYKKRYLLEKHVATHSETKEYECEICGKKFSQQQYLTAHVKRHSGVRKYSCSCCSRKFYTKGKLTEHERVHKGERIYKCKYCDSSFFYGHNLKRHQLCHTGLKPFLCKHCHKTFRTKSNLYQHFRTFAHKDETTRTYSVIAQ